MLASRLGIFANRDFTIYWTGGALSNVGTWLQNVAAAVLMLELTGSPFMVGLLGTASFLPILAFTLFAGDVSDRLDRRRIVIVTHLLATATTAVLAFVALTGAVAPWHLLAVGFLTNAAYAFAKPALVSILPALVPRAELAEATSINVLQFQVGQIAGSLVAAVVLLVATPGVAFALNALTFLAPAVAMVLIHPRPTEAPRVAGAAARGLTAGFRFLWAARPLLGAVVAVAVANALVEATRTLSPVLVGQLGAEPSATGLLIASASIGSAIAILAIPWLLRVLSMGRLTGAGFVAQVIGVVLQGLAPGLEVAVAGAFLVGVGFSLAFTQMTALLQIASPEDLRGRVMAIHTLSHLGLRPLWALLVGSFATLGGARFAIVVFAVLAPIGLVGAARASREDLADTLTGPERAAA
ncbi:MAG TPA: MFS transporter [Candidatus Limnocylindrales bacterium]|nr:MFS transporter [Candidatus Limnocylindrales bacterium]